MDEYIQHVSITRGFATDSDIEKILKYLLYYDVRPLSPVFSMFPRIRTMLYSHHFDLRIAKPLLILTRHVFSLHRYEYKYIIKIISGLINTESRLHLIAEILACGKYQLLINNFGRDWLPEKLFAQIPDAYVPDILKNSKSAEIKYFDNNGFLMNTDMIVNAAAKYPEELIVSRKIYSVTAKYFTRICVQNFIAQVSATDKNIDSLVEFIGRITPPGLTEGQIVVIATNVGNHVIAKYYAEKILRELESKKREVENEICLYQMKIKTLNEILSAQN